MRALVLIAVLALGGCAGTGKPSLEQIKPICTAMIGPIKYNSAVRASRRFAGPDLAPDLKRRNQVGEYLRCPAYRNGH